MAHWRGAQYFNDQAVGQGFAVRLMTVPLDTATKAYDAGSNASNALASTATVLATTYVKRIAGNAGNDCPQQ